MRNWTGPTVKMFTFPDILAGATRVLGRPGPMSAVPGSAIV